MEIPSWEFFRDKVKRFREEEIRAIFYEIAMNILKDNRVIDSIKVILLSWNMRPYLGKVMSKKKLEEQISNFLENHEKEIELLKDREICTIDFNKHVDKIKKLYKDLTNLEYIGSTGASKFLHILNRDLFVMWDGDIMNRYHKEHPKHTKGSEECYLEFLKDMQELTNKLLVEIEEKGHLTPKDYLLEQLSRDKYEITLAKVLDEYNYMTKDDNS